VCCRPKLSDYAATTGERPSETGAPPSATPASEQGAPGRPAADLRGEPTDTEGNPVSVEVATEPGDSGSGGEASAESPGLAAPDGKISDAPPNELKFKTENPAGNLSSNRFPSGGRNPSRRPRVHKINRGAGFQFGSPTVWLLRG
jgi:hypothetical protein